MKKSARKAETPWESTVEKCTSIQPGDMVFWYSQGIVSNQPLPAMVVAVRAQGTLCLVVFEPGGMSHLDGVQNKEYPKLSAAHKRTSGCWGFRDQN